MLKDFSEFIKPQGCLKSSCICQCLERLRLVCETLSNESGKIHLASSGDQDLWVQHGVVDEVLQGGGREREQSDAFKPALSALSQHCALEVVQRRLFASLGVADAACAPDHVTTIHTALQVSRQDPGAPRQHSSGTREASDQRGRRLEGDASLPSSEQSIRILDTPLWHPDFVRNQLAATCAV